MKIATFILANAVALAASGAAQSATIVFDPTIFGQAVQQVAYLTQQITLMQQQYQQMMQTYQAIAHLPQNGLANIGQQLNTTQFRNALPPQGAYLGSMMDGTSLGSAGLGAAAQTYLNQNRVHLPSALDFQSTELQRNANSVAGAQAMASTLYQSAANRITVLQGIEPLLATAPDAKAIADIQARIAAEQAYIQAQQVQAQSLAMWQASQERNQSQRSQEERRRQVDSLIDAAKAHGG